MLLHVHGVAEVGEQLPGAAAASFVFLVVPGFAAQKLLVLERHGSTANPILAIVNVNMVELSHWKRPPWEGTPIVIPDTRLREGERRW